MSNEVISLDETRKISNAISDDYLVCLAHFLHNTRKGCLTSLANASLFVHHEFLRFCIKAERRIFSGLIAVV